MSALSVSQLFPSNFPTSSLFVSFGRTAHMHRLFLSNFPQAYLYF